MEATGRFFQWWFSQWGIGGWVIFALLAVAAIAWMIYDTQTRRVRVVGWTMATILPALLLLPSALFSLSPNLQQQMRDLPETFFYLGVIGGIVPIVVAVGYGITYKGMRGCDRGHIYDASLAECPYCSPERPQPALPGQPWQSPPPVSEREEARPAVSSRPTRSRANAWLVDERSNHNYQLYQGDTRVGRSKQANDVVFADKAISREHVLIREDRGHFTIYDRGSRTGTLINGRRLESPVLLAHDDVIEIGDTRLRFVTSRQ